MGRSSSSPLPRTFVRRLGIVQQLPRSALPSCISATVKSPLFFNMQKKKNHRRKTSYYSNTRQAPSLAGERASPRAALREGESAADNLFLNRVTSARLTVNV